MDLKFLLTAIGLLAGIWVYLYKTISNTTINAPAHQTLIILGYAQFTVLAYVFVALYILYATDAGTTPAQPGPLLAIATDIFHHTWPIPLVCLAVAFLAARASESQFAMMSYPFILIIVGIAVAIVQALHSHNPKFTMIFLALIALLGVPYMIFMAFFLADVEITTDKEFYTERDSVTICVRPAGYIFRPRIERVSLGDYPGSRPYFYETVIVTPDLHRGSETIFVDYVPQGNPFKWIPFKWIPFKWIQSKRTTTHNIKIAKIPGGNRDA